MAKSNGKVVSQVLSGRELGQNVSAEVDGNVLIIRVDLSQRHGESGSGKTTRIASTLYDRPLHEYASCDVWVGVNVYVPSPKETAKAVDA